MTSQLELLDEQERLSILENIVEHELTSFVNIGEALLEIRDTRLYKVKGYSSFGDYTRERWVMLLWCIAMASGQGQIRRCASRWRWMSIGVNMRLR